MQRPHDTLSKGLIEGALRGLCVVRTHVEVLAEVQAIDALVKPIRKHLDALAQRGWLGWMARELAVIEPYHPTPTVFRIVESEMRVHAWYVRQHREAEKLKKPPPQYPRHWVVSTGRPDAVMAAWNLIPLEGAVAGMYRSSAPIGPRLVVASELPETRETLALRFMGTGETRRRAWQMWKTLPPDAWEHRVVHLLLNRLRRDLPRMEWPDELVEELGMNYAEIEKLYEQDMREVREEGRKKGRKEGLVKGELVVLRGQFERRLGRELTDDEAATLRARLKALGPQRLGEVVLDLKSKQLAAWLADPKAR